MGKDITRVLVEATIRKTLKGMDESPERTMRNLVDLALSFSNGRFQKSLFSITQNMLQNENSAYYDLAKDLIAHVNADALTAFGLNLGYNSCTSGAKKIRDTEQKEGFNIPWCLSLLLHRADWPARRPDYTSLLEQGQALGIHTYLLFCEDDPSFLLPFLANFPDCAFILFTQGRSITPLLLDRAAALHHVMFAILWDQAAEPACALLRRRQFLFSLYYRYGAHDRSAILSGGAIRQLTALHPAFCFFIPDDDCPPDAEAAVYRYLTRTREEQKIPALLMDIKYDNRAIDGIISDDACTAVIEANGALCGFPANSSYNLFTRNLESVLRQAFPSSASRRTPRH